MKDEGVIAISANRILLGGVNSFRARPIGEVHCVNTSNCYRKQAAARMKSEAVENVLLTKVIITPVSGDRLKGLGRAQPLKPFSSGGYFTNRFRHTCHSCFSPR